MTRSRLRISKIDGRRYRYPYPIYYRPPLRWLTPSYTAKKVSLVARDFGPEILHAIRHNNLECLKKILERRLGANFLISKLCMTDVSQRLMSRHESCPLIIAAKKKDPTILRYMLEKGADPNYIAHDRDTLYSYTALHVAAKLGRLETVATLLSSKADPNIADSKGDCPLHVAVHANDCALAKLLLLHGANPNSTDRQLRTPLHIATSHGNLEMVNLLMEHGADVKIPNRYGALPVHASSSAGHTHLIKALLSTMSVDTPCTMNGIKQNSLHMAADNGHVETVQTLLDLKADINARDSAGNTALHHLVLKPYQPDTMRDMNQYFATALTLIKTRVNITAQNNAGETALSYAASNGYPKIAKLIQASMEKDFQLGPELLNQILSDGAYNEQENALNSMSSVNANDERIPDTSGSLISAEKVTIVQSGQPVKSVDEDSKLYSQTNKESHPIKEFHSKIPVSVQKAPSTEAAELNVKRFPLPKSDLRNYQQFGYTPTIENEISSFKVAGNKGAERMCVLLEKTSPRNSVGVKKSGENEAKDSGQKHKSTSTDVTRPVVKKLKSTEDDISKGGENQPLMEGNRIIREKEQEKYNTPNISKPLSDPNSAKGSDTKYVARLSEVNDDEESCWIDHKVERWSLVSPVGLKDIHRRSTPTFRLSSKSPSGFFSEGGGLRRLKMRVAGEVPKAYTCKQKAAARKAFILAHPIGIERVGDYDRTRLSMMSLPEVGEEAYDRAMQRRLEWTEPPKPFFTKSKSSSREFSPVTVNRNPSADGEKHDYRISGLYPQPYKSFGKIETKTDAIEEAMLDYDTEEDYESDDEIEPMTTEWVSDVTQQEWRPIDDSLVTPYDEGAAYVDEEEHGRGNTTLSSVEADEIAGYIGGGLNETKVGDTQEPQQWQAKMDTVEQERGTRDRVQMLDKDAQVDRTYQGNDRDKEPRSSAGLLNLLHGYHPQGTSYRSATMVETSLEPEIQRLTTDNIVVADSSSSDDQGEYEIPERTDVPPSTGKIYTEENSNRGIPGMSDNLEHIDKEIEEIFKSRPRVVPVSPTGNVSGADVLQSHERSQEKPEVIITDFEVEKDNNIIESPEVSSKISGEVPKEMNILPDRETLEEPKKKKKKGTRQSEEQKNLGEGEEIGKEVVPEDELKTQLPQQSKTKTRKIKSVKQGDEEPGSRSIEIGQQTNIDQPHVVEDILGTDKVVIIDKEQLHEKEPGRKHKKKDVSTIQNGNTAEDLKGKENMEMEDIYAEEPGKRVKHRKQKVKESKDKKETVFEDLDQQQHMIQEEKVEYVKQKPNVLFIDEQEDITGVESAQREADKKQLAQVKEIGRDESTGDIEQEEGLEQDVIMSKSKQTKPKKKKVVSKKKDLGEGDWVVVSIEEKGEILLKHENDTIQHQEVTDVSQVADGTAEDLEVMISEDPKQRRKEEKKLKKKVKAKPEDVSEQMETQVEETGDKDLKSPTDRDTSVSYEVIESVESTPSKVKKKKTKKTTAGTDIVLKDGRVINSAVQAEVWQEAMEGTPLASSETVYDSMRTSESDKKGKKVKRRTSGSKKENVLEDIGNNNIMEEEEMENAMKPSEDDQQGTEGALKKRKKVPSSRKTKSSQQTTDFAEEDVEVPPGVRPAKETNIDDDLAQWNNYVNASGGAELSESYGSLTGKRVTMETSVDDIMDEVHPNAVTMETSVDDIMDEKPAVTMETSVDDIMDDIPASGVTMETSVDDIMDEIPAGELEVVAERVFAVYEASNAVNIPPSNGDSLLIQPEVVEQLGKKRKPIETSIDDEIDEFPSCREGDSVERSLETNIDDFIEDFSGDVSADVSKDAVNDVEKNNLLNLKEFKSKASKVTNIDDYQMTVPVVEKKKHKKRGEVLGDEQKNMNGRPVDEVMPDDTVEIERKKATKKKSKIPQLVSEETEIVKKEKKKGRSVDGQRSVEPVEGEDHEETEEISFETKMDLKKTKKKMVGEETEIVTKDKKKRRSVDGQKSVEEQGTVEGEDHDETEEISFDVKTDLKKTKKKKVGEETEIVTKDKKKRRSVEGQRPGEEQGPVEGEDHDETNEISFDAKTDVKKPKKKMMSEETGIVIKEKKKGRSVDGQRSVEPVEGEDHDETNEISFDAKTDLKKTKKKMVSEETEITKKKKKKGAVEGHGPEETKENLYDAKKGKKKLKNQIGEDAVKETCVDDDLINISDQEQNQKQTKEIELDEMGTMEDEELIEDEDWQNGGIIIPKEVDKVFGRHRRFEDDSGTPDDFEEKIVEDIDNEQENRKPGSVTKKHGKKKGKDIPNVESGEVGAADDFVRRKKTKKEVLTTANTEGGIDGEEEEMRSPYKEKQKKKSKGKTDKGMGHKEEMNENNLKFTNNVKRKETDFEETKSDEELDEREMFKKDIKVPAIKRFEDSGESEDSEDENVQDIENELETRESDTKKHGKRVQKKGKEILNNESEQGGDIDDLTQHKKSRPGVMVTEYREEEIDEEEEDEEEDEEEEEEILMPHGKNQKRKYKERPYKGTLVEEDIDEDEDHLQSEEKEEDFEETKSDEDLDEKEMFKKQDKKFPVIKRFEDSETSKDSDDIVQLQNDSATKSFSIGDARNVNAKAAAKKKKETPVEDSEEFPEFRRRKKIRKPVTEATFKETGFDDGEVSVPAQRELKQAQQIKDNVYKETEIDEDLESKPKSKRSHVMGVNVPAVDEFEVDEEFTDDENRYDIPVIVKEQVEKLRAFKKYSDFSDESEDGSENDEETGPGDIQLRPGVVSGDKVAHKTAEDVENYEEYKRRKKPDRRQAQQDKQLTEKERKSDKEKQVDRLTKAENGSENESESEEEMTDEEEENVKDVKPLKKTEAEVNRRKSGKEGTSKQLPEGRDYENTEDLKKKTMIADEDEEDEFTEYKRRPKSGKARRVQSPTGKKVVAVNHDVKTHTETNIDEFSETNIDELSESEESDEHQTRIVAKVESLLAKKRTFSEPDEKQNEEDQIQTEEIGRFIETSNQVGIDKYSVSNVKRKQKTMETALDDDIPVDSDLRIPGQKQVNKPKNDSAIETDESEEVTGEFSRRQPGRVGQGRVKKGTKNAPVGKGLSYDAESSGKGDSNDDSSAGIRRSKKSNVADTEIKRTSQRKSGPATSPTMSSDTSRNFSPQQNVRSQDGSQRSDRSANQTPIDMDADERIRRQRRMDMTETVTKTTTTKTKTTARDGEKTMDESSRSLPSLPNKGPPLKREIKPLKHPGSSVSPPPQETTFEMESAPVLDMSLPEKTPSKNEPFERNSMDMSLVRRITTGHNFQHKAQRQNSADGLNRQHLRARSTYVANTNATDPNVARLRHIRSRSTGHIDIRSRHSGMRRIQRDPRSRPMSVKQPDRTLEQAALESITATSINEQFQKRRRQIEYGEKPIVFTRGIYRPQPVYWRGLGHGTNDKSRAGHDKSGLDESYFGTEADGGNRSVDSLDKSKQNETVDANMSSPPQLETFGSSPPQLSLSKDDISINRPSAFVMYNRRVTILDDPRRRHGRRRHRSLRSSARRSYDDSIKPPRIMEPNAVDFSKYGIVAQLWMEQVDMATVLKSRTMYLTVLPAKFQPPDELTRSIKYVPIGDDLALPAQWVIARGRTIRQRKRELDEYHNRMSDTFNLSGWDSDPELSRSAIPMSPGKQSMLFFKVGGRWPELAWVLFGGVQSDSTTIRMIKDIQLKNAGKLTEQIQDMMSRWWKLKGSAATIEELKRSLDLINLPYIQDETFNDKLANPFFGSTGDEIGLVCKEVDSGDPDATRMINEYRHRSINASFSADHHHTPVTPQPFISDALLRQSQLKGLQTHSSPTLRHSKLKPGGGENQDNSLGRSDSKDGTRTNSVRLFSSQDSLDVEDHGDDKRKSVQGSKSQKSKKEKFRHESNI